MYIPAPLQSEDIYTRNEERILIKEIFLKKCITTTPLQSEDILYIRNEERILMVPPVRNTITILNGGNHAHCTTFSEIYNYINVKTNLHSRKST